MPQAARHQDLSDQEDGFCVCVLGIESGSGGGAVEKHAVSGEGLIEYVSDVDPRSIVVQPESSANLFLCWKNAKGRLVK